MSKNHPNDNMYSILGKLAALKPTPEEKRFALVKEIRESVEAKGSILTGVDAVQAKLAKSFAESKIEEKAVSQAQQKFMGMVHAAQKGGKAASPEVAKVAKDMGKKDAQDFASTKHKGLPQHVEEETCNECGMTMEGCGCEHTNEGELSFPEKGVTRHTKTDFPGYPTDDGEGIDDENKGKRGRPRKHAKVAPKTDAEGNKLGRGRPAKVKAPSYSKMSDPFGRTTGAVPKAKVKGRVHTLDEAMAQVQANLTEGRHMVDESGETLKHILNRFRHEVRNFEQGGDLDKDLYDALFDYYSESGDMPYGVQKARTGDPMNWVADQLNVELGDIAYGSDPANAEVADEAIDPTNPRDYEIPAVQRKAAGQSPLTHQDIIDKDQKAAMDYQRRVGNVKEDPLHHELNELARLAGLKTEGNAFSGKLAHTAKGDNFEHEGETFTNRSSIADKDLEEDDMEEGNAFGKAVADAKADGVQPGEKVEVGGKEIPVKEEETDEGNEFSGELAKAKAQHKDSFKVGEKTYTVKEAQELVAMLKIAGLDTAILEEAIKQAEKDDACTTCDCDPCECNSEKVDEAKIKVDDEDTDPVNKPDPKYASMKGSTMGPGEGDAGEKEMNPDRPTFKNGDNALAKPSVRESVIELESRLASEYESIKKVN